MEKVTISKAEYDSFKAMEANYAYLQKQVDFLMEQMRLARHKQFGSSSEKSQYDNAEQINLFNEAEAEADVHAKEPALSEVKKHYRKAYRKNRDRLPDDLPVEIIEHTLPEDELECPECGYHLHAMGKETREELKLIPAKAVIVCHIKTVYACRSCEKDGCDVPIIKAPIENPVIKGSFASPEAVAHIMCQKFVMGIPLYRQEQEWKRQGIELSRQTMSNWIIRCAEDWLEPIYCALMAIMLACYDVLHADETTLQALHEPGKPPQSNSYMWLYRTSGFDKNGIKTTMPVVLYEYQPDRKATHPEDFLHGWKGYLHTDGYAGYHSLEKGGDVTVVGCLAHARRRFDEALKGIAEKDREGSGAMTGKQYCNRLFAIEREIAGLSPEERYNERQKQSKPVMDAFFAWLNSGNYTKNALGRAVQYTLDQWKYLERFLLDGRLEISNNRAERSIKPFVIGRKNFLFANTPKGAKASAIIYSIVETAKESGVDPYSYLSFVFKTAPNLDFHNNPDLLEYLLLFNFKQNP